MASSKGVAKRQDGSILSFVIETRVPVYHFIPGGNLRTAKAIAIELLRLHVKSLGVAILDAELALGKILYYSDGSSVFLREINRYHAPSLCERVNTGEGFELTIVVPLPEPPVEFSEEKKNEFRERARQEAFRVLRD